MNSRKPPTETGERHRDDQQRGVGWPHRTNWNSCLDQVIQICWRWGGHRLERQRRHLVCHSMLDWQPVERPEKWSGIGSTTLLADDTGYVVLRSLQYIESRSWCSLLKYNVSILTSWQSTKSCLITSYESSHCTAMFHAKNEQTISVHYTADIDKNVTAVQTSTWFT